MYKMTSYFDSPSEEAAYQNRERLKALREIANELAQQRGLVHWEAAGTIDAVIGELRKLVKGELKLEQQ